MMDALCLLGLNHHLAPVEVRGQLAFRPEQILRLLGEMTAQQIRPCGVIREAVMLSTCFRTELYLWLAEPVNEQILTRAEAEARTLLARYSTASDLCVFSHGEQVAEHLLRVAAGLDSLVLGECEVLGQVRAAYELAQQAGSAGAMLSALFRQAIQAGKRVRHETDLGRLNVSIGTVLVEHSEQLFGSLSGRTALLIGAGKISAITARALLRAGLHCVLVANRTYDKAKQLAEALGGQAVHFDALREYLSVADIVICSTSAPHILLHAGDVQAVIQDKIRQAGTAIETADQSGVTRMLIADLSVPCNADPAIAELPGVKLVRIDDLALDLQRHPLSDPRVEEVLSQELNYFQEWCSARRSAALIRALRQQAEAICEAEIQRTLRRMGTLTEEQKEQIRLMGQALINKMLHQPIDWLRHIPCDEDPEPYYELIEELYRIS